MQFMHGKGKARVINYIMPLMDSLPTKQGHDLSSPPKPWFAVRHIYIAIYSKSLQTMASVDLINHALALLAS